MLKRPKLLLAVILLLGGAGGALAQAVVQQYGTVTAGHLAMFLSNGRVVDAGGSQGAGMAPANSALAGTRPTGLGIVNSGLGQCQFSSYATGSYYNTLCSGFDASGNPSVQAGRVGSGTALPLSLPNTVPQLARVTVAELLALTCNSGAEGTMYAVTDSNTATFNATIASSGANRVIGYCNASNWVVH